MIIDNMRDHNAIYQMLSVIRDPKIPRNLANSRVAMAIDSIGFGQFSGAERRIYTDLKLELSYQYQAFPIFSCGLGADLGYRWVQELKINPLVFRGYIRLTLFDKLVIDAGYRVMDHGPNRKDALPVFARVSVKDIVSTAYWIGRLL